MTTAVQEMAVPKTAKQSDAAPREYLWTADDFERACEAGALGRDRRLELTHGRLIDRMRISPTHAEVADYLADCLRAVFSADLKVREEKPILIGLDTEPVPDITVVRRAPQRYLTQHPSPEDVALLVAVSSADYDLGEKALLYAQAGIADYWVVLPNEKEIAVHRDPTSDGYASVAVSGAGQSISPLAAPETLFAVADLLGLPEEGAAAQ